MPSEGNNPVDIRSSLRRPRNVYKYKVKSCECLDGTPTCELYCVIRCKTSCHSDSATDRNEREVHIFFSLVFIIVSYFKKIIWPYWNEFVIKSHQCLTPINCFLKSMFILMIVVFWMSTNADKKSFSKMHQSSGLVVIFLEDSFHIWPET